MGNLRYSTEDCLGEIKNFETVCNDYNISTDNRFTCIQDLSAPIAKKKGAHLEDERLSFLWIIFTCLSAPDSFFGGKFTTESEELKKKKHKEVDKFIRRYNDFARNYSASINIYIEHLRNCFKNNLTHKNIKSDARKKELKEKRQNKLKETLKKSLNIMLYKLN